MQFLVVSDDATITEKLRELLAGQHGVRTVTTSDALLSTSLLACDAVIVVLPSDLAKAKAVIRDLRELESARIVAVASATDVNFILQLQREGVFHFVNRDELAADLAAAVERVRAEPRPASKHGRVISVVSAGGGSGASMVSANLAAALCHGTAQCGLLDFKLESGTLASMLDLTTAHSLADFCQNMSRMDASMFEACFARHDSGVRLLASPSHIDDIANITPLGARRAIIRSSKTFPYVVIDIGTPYREEHAVALRHSDAVLLVMQFDFACLNQARRVLEHLSELRINTSKVRLIVNRYRGARGLRVQDVETTLGLKVSKYLPEDTRGVMRSVNNGLPIVLGKPRAKVSRELFDIARSVNGVLNHGNEDS